MYVVVLQTLVEFYSWLLLQLSPKGLHDDNDQRLNLLSFFSVGHIYKSDSA